ncbi:unnamed protein product [Trifolium pratense]|uniref:Uncharacterized protein n=1 Tax=Trifolium pratense TaxID=57577 RepID=A0ACB0KX16_TRIPR|nr:unnamed protein product [Trifolium pratense]
MAANNTSNGSKGIFTNYITSPLSTEKLNGSNYDSWAADIKLWVTGQGYKDHLTTKSDTVTKADKPKWEQIDAQLCSVIKSTLHPDIKPIFRPHITCESVWSQAKKLYTNDTQRLYEVCHKLMNIITPKKIDGSISTYLGNVHSALHDFNELLPPAASSTTEQEKEREQRSTFFMLLALYGLPEEYYAIRDQILGSATVPNISKVHRSFDSSVSPSIFLSSLCSLLSSTIHNYNFSVKVTNPPLLKHRCKRWLRPKPRREIHSEVRVNKI